MNESLKHFAERFDAIEGKRRHTEFDFASRMVGPSIGVRYFLGCLSGRNLFLASDVEVRIALIDYFAPKTSKRGAEIVGANGLQGWRIAVVLLRHIYETQTLGTSSVSDRRAATIREFLSSPSITATELARTVGTTVKQLSRNTDWNLFGALANQSKLGSR
jgi:hypothetical protein